MARFLGYLAFGLLSLQAAFAAEDPIEVVQAAEAPDVSSSLKVEVDTSFPQSEIFGVKLVNGIRTEAHISLSNHEPEPIIVRFIGGSIWTADSDGAPSQALRNLTTVPYDGLVPAGEKESFTFKFVNDMHPRDVRLQLVALVNAKVGGQDVIHQVLAYNETVSIVEAPTSFFDPQILFLYLILAGAFAGASYFVYNTWLITLFPQQKKRSTKGVKSPKTPKTAESSAQVSMAGSDGVAVASGSKGYDESWIPAHHIQRPEAKRIRSGTPTGAKTKRVA